MKKISFLMAALLVAMVGCQKEPQANEKQDAGGEVYMSFSVQAITKSQTDNTGNSNSDATPETEVGKDVENKISNVQIYLHSTEGEIKATNVNLAGGGVNYTATFKEEDIKAGVNYSIYVICNENDAINNLEPNTLVKQISGTDGRELNISEDNLFLMTNANTPLVKSITVEELQKSMSPATPFNLGIINVERSVARFDYASTQPNNLYKVSNSEDISIALERAAVINVSKGSYYFRRVAATESGADFVVGGVEGIQANGFSNYVVDYNWAAKKTLKNGWASATAAENFIYPLENKESWEWINLTSLNEADNIDPIETKDYNFLAYVSENTIPGADHQINGLSTGVVFRGYLHNGTERLKGTGLLYVYANKYYGNWDAVQTAATTGTDAALTAAYEAVKANPTNLANCAKAGFTVYTPNGSGNYPVDYYYWNRHHNNLNNNEMGIMEFAVVRNNVYKLAVTKINNYGHPENPEGDPDPVTPSTPDEQKRHYFQVSVKVLPWTVRVNDIEF